MLLVLQSRNLKCLLCSELLSIMDNIVKVEDTMSSPGRRGNLIGSSYVPKSTKYDVSSEGYYQSVTWLTTNQKSSSGLLWILLLGGFRFLDLLHDSLLPFKLRIIPAVYQVMEVIKVILRLWIWNLSLLHFCTQNEEVWQCGRRDLKIDEHSVIKGIRVLL